MQRACYPDVKLCLCLMFSVCGIVGCSADSGPPGPAGAKSSAKGKISYKGVPITVGTITLDSGKGYLAMAPIKPDGTFELQGPNGAVFPGGNYKVGVTPPDVPPVPGATEMKPKLIPGVPAKFYSTQSSGVKVDIKDGAQELDIKLE